MARFRAGDHPAFDVLVARHERRIFNLAYRMLGRPEDARDATQEAFLSCFRRLDQFRGDAKFTTWLYRIAVIACTDILRKPAARLLGDPEAAEPPPSPDHAEAAAIAVDVQRALMRVPGEFRVALIMHDVQGLAYEEIAEALGLPLGTVKSRLHRGRVALARALTGEHPGVRDPSNPRSR